MKHSIRFRFTMIFAGLMGLVLIAMLGINNWWLEKYYVNNKAISMEEAYMEIDKAIMAHVDAGENIGDVLSAEIEQEKQRFESKMAQDNAAAADGSVTPPTDENTDVDMPDLSDEEKEGLTDHGSVSLVSVIRSFGERSNIAFLLIDSATGKAMLSSARDGDFLAQKAERYFLGQTGPRMEVLREHVNYSIVRNFDKHTNSSYMESWGFLSDNSTMIVMSMPLASIKSSVALSNTFLTYVGIVALIIGSILTYFASCGVTSPIMKLARISEQMSELDFTARYEGHAQDEVGVLGRSMNTMSNKLEETIGELKSANNQLQKDIAEKIQVDEMRKEFIANVSHELKTPIALIQGYAEGLTEGMCEDEDSRNYYCNVIMDEANKMNKMVRQLLALSAIEFGNDTPIIERFNLTDLIGDVLNSASIILQQKEAAVSCEVTDDIYVWADEFKIEEVLNNYLNNAMNHLDGERKICIRAEQHKDTVKVFVSNTGIPIPQEDISNLWTKFYKVDKARTRAYGGSGIGLSIVKAIMDAHNQQCGVENTKDGVEFWFTLDCGSGEKKEI